MNSEADDDDDRTVSVICVLACALLLGGLIWADKTIMAPHATQRHAAVAASSQPAGKPSAPRFKEGASN